MKRSRVGLALQFALVSALIFGVVGIATAIVVARTVANVLVDEALREAAGEVSDGIAPRAIRYLSPFDLQQPMTGERYVRFDAVLSDAILSPRHQVLNVWNKDHVLIYSTDPSNTAREGHDEGLLPRALEGLTTARVTDKVRVRDGGRRFVAVYTPIIFPGSKEPAGAFEVHHEYQPVAALVGSVRRTLYIALGAGFSIMYLAVMAVVLRGAGIIGNQQSQLTRRADELQQSRREMLLAIGRALDMRDVATRHHSLQVQRISIAIGRQLGLAPADLAMLEIAAPLHDVGKIGVPDEILKKAGPLSVEEWEEMRRHPELGHRLLSDFEFLNPAAEIVHSHHERFDGSGYPRGLAGDDIPLPARVFAVADAYEAMTSDRPYRRAMSHDEAVEEIRHHAGTQFDPEVVGAFLLAISRVPWAFATEGTEPEMARAA